MDQAIQTRWEHLAEESGNPQALQQLLAQRGAEGWELVNVVCEAKAEAASPVKTLRPRNFGGWWAFFKRPASM